MFDSILIVDDERPIRKGLRAIIERFHPRFTHVEDVGSAAEALDRCSAQRFDLVLTDISMSRMNGLELIGRLKAMRPKLQFIVISGHEDFEWARLALRYGALAWLLKPLNLHELSEAIMRGLQQVAGTGAGRGLRYGEQKGAGSCLEALMDYQGLVHNVKDEKAKLALQFIYENLHRPLDMAEVANELSFNYSYFSLWFKESVGINFNECLARLRIGRAAELLADPRLGVQEVAHSVGYPDARTFTRTFSRFAGTPPSQFRKTGTLHQASPVV